MISSSTLHFLKDLKKNNNKIWFDQHKEKYLEAKTDFELFVKDLLDRMASFEPDIKDLEPKQCTFRINRDIRFSKNKTPYKVSLSAAFNKGGKKSIYAGYYFHLQPGGNSFAGGGLWMPEPQELKKVRQEIDYCLPEFKQLVTSAAFKKHFRELEKDEKQMLKNVPKGYEKDNAAGEYLKMKSFIATRNIADVEISGARFTNEIIQSFKTLMPLIKFINRSLD